MLLSAALMVVLARGDRIRPAQVETPTPTPAVAAATTTAPEEPGR